MKSLTWRLTIIALFLCAMAAFTSCGSHSHSPMDSYSNAVAKEAQDSTRHAEELKPYLDSLKTR